MRAKLRVVSVVFGGAALVLLGLLLATAVTRSWALAAVTAGIGLLAVVGAVLVGNAAIERILRGRDRSSTRISHLDRSVATLEEQMGGADAAAEAREEASTEFRASVAAQLTELDERVGAELAEVRTRTGRSWELSTETALQLGRRPRSFLSPEQATELFEHYLDEGRLLETAPLLRNYRGLMNRDLGTLRSLYRFFKATGHWDLAATTLRQIADKSGRGSDRKAVHALEKDIAVFSRPDSVSADLPASPAYDASGPVVHMVGKLLSETQSGYTLRTHYTAQAQVRRGLPAVVVGQSGIVADSAREAVPFTIDDVDYYRLPGPHRAGVPIDQWLQHDIQEFGKLVRRLRPSILHAHSDFQNAVIVSVVGKAYGIPTVYETRGFWEESWLTRAIAANGWGRDADRLLETYGLPSAYALRKRAEETARTLTDRNITLAGVMRDHILDSAGGALREEQVSVVPNAVDPEEFPIQDRDPALAARWGLPEGAVTVGYVSSMVEYENIETLVDGFRLAAERVSVPLYLLLVGGGKHLEALRAHAERTGTTNVIFTGAVPHDDVLRYYGLIDIFVVPRGKSSVADLVTPLKPFEAFATGRAVVLSDVEALKEIAEDSGAAQTFRAGYSRDLGRKLVSLVEDSQLRRDLGVRGARWVRGHRTWDRNVLKYYRVYQELGYRGPADPALVKGSRSRKRAAESGERAGHRAQGARAVGAEDRPEDPDGQVVLREPQNVVSIPAPRPADRRGDGRRAVVVAMKPQIAGRIRRNILTLLDLGFEVTVVNTTPRGDFFQGLEHPQLSADFVDVRSMAVRYQSRMTRKKNERQVAWDREKKERALTVRAPAPDAPAWMTQGVPGTQLLHRGWTSETGRETRQRLDELSTRAHKRWRKLAGDSRSKRDLAIRDQLKQVHLLNRFVEFWRLSPDRIAEHHPDLVVSSDLPGLVGANIAARRLGVPHLHDCHELYLESTTLRPYERKALWPVEKAYLRRADSVVVVNETIRDEYEKRYGVRGTVLRNAAPAVPEEVRANPVDLRALAGLRRDEKVVIYQGGLVAGRGLDVLVRAAAHFADGVHLVLIGRGRSLDELTALADSLGILDRVHFLPAVPPGDLPAYTAAADVGVIPYQPVSRNNEYALPNKAFEYPGAGIPFVAADLPELRRIAQTARCGEVYDPFDPAQLADAVRAVLDPERYPAYRRNAETFGRENTWESEREILVGEIQRLTRSQPAE
ncbi:glycosyltransferase [Brachybacterium sp. AOP43-C2-M15]|uniref:glycosyltransferase n=1 Tax=Brachybacterium sp. AOP43-C2-M15 TaxID=3457661 RepID=UPI0040346342